jgi:hypothetical protein
MPITLPELAAHLQAIGLKHKVEPEHNRVALGFGTSQYVDLEGDKQVLVFVSIAAEGQYVEVVIPRAYNLGNCKYKGATLAALAEIAFRTRSLQCEYDPQDGEVRYSVDAWVLDNTLTRAQLEMMVRTAVQLLEEYEPVVRCAMDTGRVDFNLAVKPAEEAPEGAPGALPPEIAELIAKAGGLDALRAAVEQAQDRGRTT